MKNTDYSLFTRLAVLLLVAGFFYSCSSTQNNIDELVANENYQQAIRQINQELEDNPNQPELYVMRGEINAAMAMQTEPELRAEMYEKTAGDFAQALEYGASEIQQNKMDSLRQQYWKEEHNMGLRISENDELEDRYQRAAIHFQNAIILRDNAVSSYKNLGIARFNMGEIDAAITAFRKALNHAEEPASELYENLGYLHLEKGDPEQAAYYYELANKNLEENINLSFGLINAYIANAQHTAATQLLEPLVENNPDHADLRNVYGTQLYEVTEMIFQELEEAYKNEDGELAQQLRLEAETTAEKAEEQLIEAFKRDTLNTEYLQSLAVFYNNMSAQYLSLHKVAFPEHQQKYVDKAGNLIDFAIEYYEKLGEADPNNSRYSSKIAELESIKENKLFTDE